MVVCAMQSFAKEQQLDGCSTMNSAQSTQIKGSGIVDNGNGVDEEDREEGEIVDEFEMIISSEDEEFKLRARIQQLEDKSKDIEKMDMLSANLANQYNYQRPHRIARYTQYQHFSPISVLSDVSSLSEEEIDPPKKNRKHKGKRMETKKHGPLLRRNPFAHRSQRQEQPNRKKRRHEHHYNHNLQQQQSAILLDSLDSVTEDEIGEYDINVENENDEYEELEQLKLSRNKLRVALARTGNYDIKPKHSLKERLQYRMRKSPSPNPIPKQNQLKQNDDLAPLSFEDYSQHRNQDDEQEELQQQQQLPQIDEPPELKLRIIALKSAILKKHMARKKRDAERAYSPTDMINRVHQPTISNECDDIDDLMEISPAASPERTAYSPPAVNFEEPVDMDLVQTDSDEDRQQWPHNWQSTVSKDESWRCFLPNLLPPVSMPIVIDDDEDQQVYQQNQEQYDDDDDDVPPPPPSFHIPHMQVEDDDARDALHLSEQHSHHGSLTDIQSISMDNSQTQTQMSRTFQAESSDDEAGALRAMLLSKLKPTAASTAKEAMPSSNQKKVDAHDSDDPDELRLLLLSSIASKKKSCSDETIDDSPEILKKAVRRFQVSSLQSPEGSSGDTTRQEIPVEPPKKSVADLQQKLLLPLSLPPSVPQSASMPVAAPAPLPVPPPQLPEEVGEVASTPILHSTTLVTHSSSTDIIKIVKPNKVINKKTAPKRKISKLAQSAPPLKRPTTLLVKEPVASLHVQNGNSSTRLITTLDPASIKVNKLVITLAESSAGSDDELELRKCYAYSSYTNYGEIPSPLSQALDSASNSTTRSNTPNSEILDSSSAPSNANLRRTVINEYFEKKLDDFLKQARSKVAAPSPLALTTSNLDGETTEKIKPPSDLAQKPTPVQQSSKTKPTPVAVRHLPVASQKEYLRLIERMQLLERKKIVGTTKGAPTSITASPKNKATRSTVEVKPGDGTKEVKATAIARTGTNQSSSVAETTVNGTVGKTMLVENSKAENLPTTSMATAKATAKTTHKMPSKENRLKAFESSFLKIGGSMITNLEKSLRMVEEARMSKIARLRYSHRFEELFSEMQSVKQAMKLEEAKLSRIQPEIQASHEIIISLKQKRNKLRVAAMDLGNGLHGPDYRLLDPGKADIMRKSTQLTKEIRLYNSISKYEDTIASTTESTSKLEVQTELEPEPQPQPESQSQSVYTTENTPQSIEANGSNGDNQTQAENANENETSIEHEQHKQQPVECSAIEVAVAGEDATTVVTQLNVDKTARDTADAMPNSKSLTQPVQDVPPYTVSFMRELCASPVEESLLGEYRTPMSRNYNSQLNVNATVCPFELMGRCEDVDCSYLHLTRAESTLDSESIGTTAVVAANALV